MRLATVIQDGVAAAALVRDDRVLPLAPAGIDPWTVRGIAAGGAEALDAGPGLGRRPAGARLATARVRHAGARGAGPGRHLHRGRQLPRPGRGRRAAPTGRSSTARRRARSVPRAAVLAWDRGLTDNVDAECELGVVIGRAATNVDRADALDHVLGYTIIDDVSSRDEWLDGDQWLLGKSMPGFCPVGPWVVTRDELDPRDLRLGCTINGEPIQHDSTSSMRFGIRDIVAYLSRHADAPARRPDRHRDAGPPRDPARTRPAPPARATPPPPGSRASGSSPPPSPDRRRTAMKPQTVFLGEMTNPEVEAFLATSQTVIVPVGLHRAARPARPAADRPAHPRGGRPPDRAAGRAPSSRPRSTTRCPTRTSGSPASSTSGSRRSWR